MAASSLADSPLVFDCDTLSGHTVTLMALPAAFWNKMVV